MCYILLYGLPCQALSLLVPRSIYHVHILDLEVGHRDMTGKVGLLETKLKDCEAKGT